MLIYELLCNATSKENIQEIYKENITLAKKEKCQKLESEKEWKNVFF